MSGSEFPERLDREPRPERPTLRRGPGRAVIVAGLAVALVLGIVGGFAMKPRLKDGAQTNPVQNHRVAQVPTEPSQLGIVVDRTATQMTAPAPLPVTPLAPPPQATASAPAVPLQPRLSPASAPSPARRPIERTAGPAFDCHLARSTADRLVCVDPRLAAADRRMERAYQQALDAGVPEPILRRQQEAWLNARDQAARSGPEALADVYGERIAELQGMARY